MLDIVKDEVAQDQIKAVLNNFSKKSFLLKHDLTLSSCHFSQ